MSRSKRPQCSAGRGCWACGDKSKPRRAREENRHGDAIPAGLLEAEDRWDESGEWAPEDFEVAA